MNPLLMGFVGGALCGILAGATVSLLVSLNKDPHSRPPPIKRNLLQRVFHRFRHSIHFGTFGAVQAALLVQGLDFTPMWAALSVFVYPALLLALGVALLLLLAVANWFGRGDPSRPRDGFDPQTLIHKNVSEATLIAQQNGWRTELREESHEQMPGHSPDGKWDLRPLPQPGTITLYIRDGEVVRVDVVNWHPPTPR